MTFPVVIGDLFLACRCGGVMAVGDVHGAVVQRRFLSQVQLPVSCLTVLYSCRVRRAFFSF